MQKNGDHYERLFASLLMTDLGKKNLGNQIKIDFYQKVNKITIFIH